MNDSIIMGVVFALGGLCVFCALYVLYRLASAGKLKRFFSWLGIECRRF